MMKFPKVLFVEKAAEKIQREGAQNKTSDPLQNFGTRGRSSVRFLPTGLFGELEHRQGLRAIKRVLRG